MRTVIGVVLLTIPVLVFRGPFWSQGEPRQSGQPAQVGKRKPWTASRITGSPEPPLPYKIVRAFPRLTFRSPLLITSAPGSNRFFVGEHMGKIYSFPNDQNCTKADLFLDLSRELTSWDRRKIHGIEALYGLTFHPQYAQNRYCYICYVLAGNLKNGSRVSRFRVRDTDPPRVDPKSEKIIITWPGGGHNGGDLKFGKDGFLYISTGDGATSTPPDRFNIGQDLRDLRGRILRINVDKEEQGKPYAIPPDNPFIKHPGARPEIYAYGLRNPWRMSFDRQTGELWVGDVGWELWEMVYRVQKGGNYGWAIMEGRQPVRPNAQRGPTPILPPTLDFPHSEAASITGGYVYRGKKHQDLIGAYICGDWVTRRVWATKFDGDKIVWHKEIARGTQRIVAFGEDHDGELYFLDYDDHGTVLRLEPNEVFHQPGEQAWKAFPRKLSETGLFASTREHLLADGVVPFSVNAERWFDHATAERFIALPGTTTVRVYDKLIPIPGSYYYARAFFPKGGVLAKTVFLEMDRGNPKSRRRLETQILHCDGTNWHPYTYQWNDEQTDATLVPAGGAERSLEVIDASAPGGKRLQTWRFASRAECVQCHTPRIGSVLAFTLPQLNKECDHTEPGRNQIQALKDAGIIAFFRKELSKEARARPVNPYDPGARYKDSIDVPVAEVSTGKLANPHDPQADLENRARAYLHVNCAHCHTKGAGGSVPMDLRYNISLEQTRTVGVRPIQGSFDIPEARLIVPGDPYRSVLYLRLAKLGRGRMPHIGSYIVDEQGLQLIHDWIGQMPAGAASRGKEEGELLDKLCSAKKESERGKLIKQLLSTPGGALRLASACGRGWVAEPARTEVVVAATAQPNSLAFDLFERFLPDDKRVKRLGIAFKPEAVLSLKGDANRGRELFFRGAGLQCIQCHRVHGIGASVGPDLTEIGKKLTKNQLLGKLLDPSKNIEPKYLPYLVTTKAGRVYTGILIEKNAGEIILKTAEDKEVRLPVKHVERMEASKKSLMPDQQLRDLTAQQAADLLEYLQSLR